MLETLPSEILGESPEASRLRGFVESAGRSAEPVTLIGEPGTGKKVTGRLIHEASPRSRGPFLMIDCSLFYERELKRELFGYVSAGARGKSRKGLFEFASRGTCYLSRVEELSPGIQADILQFLRTGRFSRLGDGKHVVSGVRLIVSSTKNLFGFVEAGLFDSSLFEELSKLNFKLPPLRERSGDIPAIIARAFSSQSSRDPLIQCPTLSSEALQALQAYPWPGNLAELEREIRRMLGIHGSSIRPEQLAMEISSYWLGQRGDPEVRAVLEELDGHIREFRVLSRLDMSYSDLLETIGGAGLGFQKPDRDWKEEH